MIAGHRPLQSGFLPKALQKSSPGELSTTLKSNFELSTTLLSTTLPTQHGNQGPFGPIGAKAQRPKGPVASEARGFDGFNLLKNASGLTARRILGRLGESLRCSSGASG